MKIVAPAVYLEQVLRIQGTISQINPNILSIECITNWNYYTKWTVFMIMPVGLIIAGTFFVGLMELWTRLHSRPSIGQLPLPPSGKPIDPQRPYDREVEEVRPPSPPAAPDQTYTWVPEEYDHVQKPSEGEKPAMYDENMVKIEPGVPKWRIVLCNAVVVLFVVYPTVLESCAKMLDCKDLYYGRTINEVEGTTRSWAMVGVGWSYSTKARGEAGDMVGTASGAFSSQGRYGRFCRGSAGLLFRPRTRFATLLVPEGECHAGGWGMVYLSVRVWLPFLKVT